MGEHGISPELGTSAFHDDRIAAGNAALERAAWDEARSHFQAATDASASGEAFEGLSWAAWWLNDAEALFEARERAFATYRSAGNRLGAARVAAWIGTDHVDFRGELSVAQGWFGRARRLLEGLEPSLEHGWLAVHEGEKHLMSNRTIQARESGAYAADLGRRFDSIDLEMMGLATEGLALVSLGHAEEGMSRLDEAAAAAFGGEFEQTWATAWCGCYVIYACERVRDYARAGEWCRRFEEWSQRTDSPFVNRVCRAHYAGILIWNGSWDKAEEILVEANDRLAVIRPPMATEAAVRLGELRRRQGRLDDASAFFEAAADHELALIGLAEVCLDRHDFVSARDRAEQYLREVPPESGTVRAAGLELLVRALTALGDHARAEEALSELTSISQRVGTDPLLGSAAFARGTLAAATGDLDQARIAFEDATRCYQRSGASFDAARARLELARVLAAGGRQPDATREAKAAATSFRRIGADSAAANAEDLALEFQGGQGRDTTLLTARECEVLRHVAEGKSDRVIAEALVLSEHTVHRHVANILAKLACSSRSAAVAEAVRRGII